MNKLHQLISIFLVLAIVLSFSCTKTKLKTHIQPSNNGFHFDMAIQMDLESISGGLKIKLVNTPHNIKK